MKSPNEVDNELFTLVCWLILAGIGWWFHAVPLAIIGALGAVSTATLYVWQRQCLSGIVYRRTIGQVRATFAERVPLEIEMTNDKILPLSWFRVDDDVPASLHIEGGTVTTERALVNTLVQVLPMLPFQRIRRRLTIVCDHRGLHTFGPATLSSGDPLGLRKRIVRLRGTQQLLVYPKVFALAPASIASRVLTGDTRSRFELLQDPSRIAGVREYRPGDPIRNVDWRATARSTTLLVREFEPSVALRVALFVDFRVPQYRGWNVETPELEFAIAVAASFVSDLVQRKIATGLFGSGVIANLPLAFPPSSNPDAPSIMLEGLARAVPTRSVAFADVLSLESASLLGGTSVGVIATDFPEATLVALAALRRRHAVTAIWIDAGQGSPPPPGLVDNIVRAEFSDDWQQREILELAT